MNAREMEVLGSLAAGPSVLGLLQVRMPRSSLYRTVRRLVRRRWVLKDGSTYSLMPAGREAYETALEGVPEPPAAAALERELPHLAYAPTPVHRAILFLACCAIVARRHKLRCSHHSCFILFGRRLCWKTWIILALSYLAGADPRKTVVYLGLESGRSMLTRKDLRGKRVMIRGLLQEPVAGLDEWLRASPEVQRLATVYLHGELTLPDENKTLRIEAVPVVTLNPRREGKDLEERLGFDEGILRRAIVADLSKVKIPSEILTKGERFLDSIRELGPARFPRPRQPEWDPSDEIEATLRRTLRDPELVIDVTMVSMLAAGATAWFSPEDALHLVVTSYLEVVETLGWLRADWRSHMTLPAAGSTPPLFTVASLPAAAPNPLSYDQKLVALEAVRQRLGLPPKELEATVRRVQEIGIRRLSELDRLDRELREAGLGLNDGTEIVALAKGIAPLLGADPARAAAWARSALQNLVAELRAQGGKADVVAAARRLAKEAVTTTSLAAEAKQLEGRITSLKQDVQHISGVKVRAHAEAVQANNEAKRVTGQLQTLREQADQVSRLLSSRRAELKGLEARQREAALDLALAREIPLALAGEIDPHGALPTHLLALIERARRGALPTLVKLPEPAQKVLVDALGRLTRSCVVPRWELESAKAEMKREAARELLQKIAAAAKAGVELAAKLPEESRVAGTTAATKLSVG